MDFFMNVVDECVKPDSTLRKVGALIDWQRLAAVSVPVHYNFMLSVGRSAVVDATIVASAAPDRNRDRAAGVTPVPAPPPVQPAGDAIPVNGAAGRGDGDGYKGDGTDPAQGGQPDRACSGLRAGVCPEPARCGASGA